jgi:hypothetical protein
LNASTSFFDEVVDASGLAAVIAPYAISRLLVRAGIASPRELTPDDLARALPELEQGLSVYLQGDELQQATAALRRLARR